MVLIIPRVDENHGRQDQYYVYIIYIYIQYTMYIYVYIYIYTFIYLLNWYVTLYILSGFKVQSFKGSTRPSFQYLQICSNQQQQMNQTNCLFRFCSSGMLRHLLSMLDDLSMLIMENPSIKWRIFGGTPVRNPHLDAFGQETGGTSFGCTEYLGMKQCSVHSRSCCFAFFT